MSNPMGRPLEREYGFKGAPLSTHANRKKEPESPSQGLLSKVSPWKMIALCLAIGVAGYLYISHVFYTQQLLSEVNQLRTQFDNARIDHTDSKLTYERMTGPAEVYSRAKTIGLYDGGPADKIINRN